MGLLKGSLAFSRYRIVGGLPDHFSDFFDERIRRYAFQSVWRTADEKASGWTSLENVLDTDFPYASYAQGRYMLFSLRVDRKLVAPSLLRLRTMEVERSKLPEAGLIDQLFRSFLALRLSEKWGSEQTRMQRWLSQISAG